MKFSRRGIRTFFVAAAALISLSAAAGLVPDAHKVLEEDPDAGVVLDVPFIAQKTYQCGPASVAMVMRHHGVDADADEISKRFESENVAGTFTVDLLIAASDAGLEAHWVSADYEQLKQEIKADRPPVVFLNLAINPLPARHFAVAVGFFEHRGLDYVVLHSGQEKYKVVRKGKFMKQWRRTDRMMLTVAEKPAPEKDGGHD